jgi:hypothetical protein
LVDALGEGGGSGAEGSWIGAVARFDSALGGGSPPAIGTGAVASRGWTAPAPGRARSVMRTVSFFSGTAEVFGAPGGGIAAVLGVGGVFSASLMEGVQFGGEILILYLADRGSRRQCDSPFAAKIMTGLTRS